MSEKKYVIIGGGIAGQTAADYLRKKDTNAEITIIAKEPYPYYSRIWLPSYITGEKSLEKLILRKEKWYQDHNIKLMLNTNVTKIDQEAHEIILENNPNRISYDKCIITTGSNPRKLPFGNVNAKGMFTLRNIEDADNIKEYIKSNNVKNSLVIGGGLLGIELGYHLLDLGLKVTICEIADYLLPRQLDEETSKRLTEYLVSKGLNIICGKSIEIIKGKEKVKGVKLKSGEEMPFEIIFQQMGIIPDIALAKASGLETDRGILINEYLQTSNPDIYAAGDCIQLNKLIWGIIPASMEQSKLAAKHILGEEIDPYRGTFWSTRLKIAGIKLTCIGKHPNDIQGTDVTIIDHIGVENHVCGKVVIENGKLKGAILLGPIDDRYFAKNIGLDVNQQDIKDNLKKN
jgi:nitrite reductase [NAD(P)H] large subunit